MTFFFGLHSIYSFTSKGEAERDPTYILIFLLLLWRMLHNQIWISLARHWTAKGKSRILDKSIEFEQVDRESNWDDQIILNGVLFYLGYAYLEGASYFPFWRTDGIILTILLHSGPVEFLYYWLHRALHHHYLYSRYDSHHHSSIVTGPITSVVHPFAEHLMYFILFSIPMFVMVFTRSASVLGFTRYITYIDLMNNLGHCNFEFLPKKLFQVLPFLKFIMYTPTLMQVGSFAVLEKALHKVIGSQEDAKKMNGSELQKSKEIIDDLKKKLTTCMNTIDAKSVELLNIQTALGQHYAASEAKERLERDYMRAREELAKLGELLKVQPLSCCRFVANGQQDILFWSAIRHNLQQFRP